MKPIKFYTEIVVVFYTKEVDFTFNYTKIFDISIFM